MPVFPKCSYHTLLNRSPTSTANGYTHLIVTAQTIQLILKAKRKSVLPVTQPAIQNMTKYII